MKSVVFFNKYNLYICIYLFGLYFVICEKLVCFLWIVVLFILVIFLIKGGYYLLFYG